MLPTTSSHPMFSTPSSQPLLYPEDVLEWARVFGLPPSEIACLFPPVDDAPQMSQIDKEHLSGTHSMPVDSPGGFLSEMGRPCCSDRYTKDFPSFGMAGGETERESSGGVPIQQGLEIDDPTEEGEHSGVNMDDLSNTFAANFGISDHSDRISSSQASLGPSDTHATRLDDANWGVDLSQAEQSGAMFQQHDVARRRDPVEGDIHGRSLGPDSNGDDDGVRSRKSDRHIGTMLAIGSIDPSDNHPSSDGDEGVGTLPSESSGSISPQDSMALKQASFVEDIQETSLDPETNGEESDRHLGSMLVIGSNDPSANDTGADGDADAGALPSEPPGSISQQDSVAAKQASHLEDVHEASLDPGSNEEHSEVDLLSKALSDMVIAISELSSTFPIPSAGMAALQESESISGSVPAGDIRTFDPISDTEGVGRRSGAGTFGLGDTGSDEDISEYMEEDLTFSVNKGCPQGSPPVEDVDPAPESRFSSYRAPIASCQELTSLSVGQYLKNPNHWGMAVEEHATLAPNSWINGAIIDLHLACTWYEDERASVNYIPLAIALDITSAEFTDAHKTRIEREIIVHRQLEQRSGQVAFLALSGDRRLNHYFVVYFDYRKRIACVYGKECGKGKRRVKGVAKRWATEWHLDVAWSRLADILGHDGFFSDVHAFRIDWIQASAAYIPLVWCIKLEIFQNGVDCGADACSVLEYLLRNGPAWANDTQRPVWIELECRNRVRQRMLMTLCDSGVKGYLAWSQGKHKYVEWSVSDSTEALMSRGFASSKSVTSVHGGLVRFETNCNVCALLNLPATANASWHHRDQPFGKHSAIGHPDRASRAAQRMALAVESSGDESPPAISPSLDINDNSVAKVRFCNSWVCTFRRIPG
jgi:hypothetical protein